MSGSDPGAVRQRDLDVAVARRRNRAGRCRRKGLVRLNRRGAGQPHWQRYQRGITPERAAPNLRSEAGRSKNAKASGRMLAIAMVLDGHSRETAAEASVMDRQTLRDWVFRYNEYGLSGLFDHAHPGPRPLLTTEQEAEVVTWVENGPNLAKDGVVRWRRVDLRDRIENRFDIVFHERSIGKLLRRLNFRRISVCPRHPETDEVCGPGDELCGLILNDDGLVFQASQMLWKGVRHRNALRCLAKL
jgi:transposase